MTVRTYVLVTLFTVLMLQGIKSEDDEAHVEYADVDDSEQKPEPEIELVPYVTPDIDPAVFLAEHFDSEDTFETKWIKSSAKKDGVDSAIDR